MTDNRIQLREVLESDLPIFYTHQADPEAARMADFPSRAREAFMVHWARIMADPGTILRTILVDGQVAGNIVCFEQGGEQDVGYWIGREFWGRGIATLALRAFLDLVQARPLYGRVARRNQASRRVLEKCGFRPHGEEGDELILRLELTFADLARDPAKLAESAALPDGAPITFRPITAGDAGLLGRYFTGLSERTISVYGPHPFDQATADKFCAEINYAETIRFIAVLSEGSGERAIAYFILQMGMPEHELNRYQGAGITLDPQTDCLVAPSVADEFQGHGIGPLMMRYVLRSARRLGRKRMALMGGVYTTNARAVPFYRKMGFITVGTFDPPWPNGKLSYDMYQVL